MGGSTAAMQCHSPRSLCQQLHLSSVSLLIYFPSPVKQLAATLLVGTSKNGSKRQLIEFSGLPWSEIIYRSHTNLRDKEDPMKQKTECWWVQPPCQRETSLFTSSVVRGVHTWPTQLLKADFHQTSFLLKRLFLLWAVFVILKFSSTTWTRFFTVKNNKKLQ